MTKPATPLPWEVECQVGTMDGWIAQVGGDDRSSVVARPEPHASKATSERKNATRVSVMNEQSAQDAAYIVHACNAYPRLVEALRKLLDAYEKRDGAVSPIAKAILHFVPAGKRKHFQDAITELRALLRELGEQ